MTDNKHGDDLAQITQQIADLKLKRKKAYARDYYQKNKAKINARSSAYYQTHSKASRAKYKPKHDEWMRNNKARVRTLRMVHNARVSDQAKTPSLYRANDHVDVGFINQLIHDQKSLCCYCETEMKLEGVDQYRNDLLSLERIDNAFGHTKDNVILCCYPCNLRRGNRYSYKQFKELVSSENESDGDDPDA
jgi:hypothetical protein